MGVLLTYPDVRPAQYPVNFPCPQHGLRRMRDRLTGAGQFARSILLPALVRQPDITLHTLVS